MLTNHSRWQSHISYKICLLRAFATTNPQDKLLTGLFWGQGSCCHSTFVQEMQCLQPIMIRIIIADPGGRRKVWVIAIHSRHWGWKAIIYVYIYGQWPGAKLRPFSFLVRRWTTLLKVSSLWVRIRCVTHYQAMMKVSFDHSTRAGTNTLSIRYIFHILRCTTGILNLTYHIAPWAQFNSHQTNLSRGRSLKSSLRAHLTTQW